MADQNTLKDLFVDTLRDVYHAEGQLVKALPKMAKAASDERLQAAFEEHLEVTRGQVERLDRIFKELGIRATGKKCAAMEGLVEEAKELLEEDAEPSVLDAALISAAQKVEHYEIASYGCVRTYARQLGYERAAELLQETLDEEAETDELLTELAEAVINVEAEEAEEEQPAPKRKKAAAGRR